MKRQALSTRMSKEIQVFAYDTLQRAWRGGSSWHEPTNPPAERPDLIL